MRQRLINKTQPQESLESTETLESLSFDSELTASRMAMSDELIPNVLPVKPMSLHSLLFDSNISKEAWAEGLKYHIKKLTNLLLNDQTQSFDQYLSSEFGADIPEISEERKKRFAEIDYRPVLQDLLQTAILIEHSTIPPYLTALYSIKDGTNALASQIIRSVAVEEMLHLIMVCNVLNAINIQPSVNKPQNYPTYPMKLPMNVDFFVGLETFSPNSIATFIAIESPSSPLVKAPKYIPAALPKTSLTQRGAFVQENNFWTLENMKGFIMENVHTIGEYYDVLFFYITFFQIIAYYQKNGSLPHSFKDLDQGGIFTGSASKQIRPEQYYGSGGKLHAVEGLAGVIAVFQEIKGQGEGADDSIFDVDPSQFEEGVELAHYFRFKEVFHEHFYVGGDYRPFTDENGMMPVSTPPNGKALPVDWSAAYPMKANPKVSDYTHKELYEQGIEFNKTYRRLLDAIQDAVEGKQSELEKSIMYMYALKEQAVALMKQPLDAQNNAGPTFEYISL
ncbi:ferritin-like domain-containing protein [Chryseobacterium sp. JK1]|uniref:ferritin-like domain-containing protein n=1 Tax=Chryseobacterium sp. JK1 TaxID=874294 RepID=UPI003D69D5B1